MIAKLIAWLTSSPAPATVPLPYYVELQRHEDWTEREKLSSWSPARPSPTATQRARQREERERI